MGDRLTKTAPSVLIVDDEAALRELLRRWLEPDGYALRFAADAWEAVMAIEERAPVVVVADVHMPGANGLWLAEQIRARAPLTAVVLATGDRNIPPYESLRHGIVAYVLKPFDRTQVLRAVAEGVRWAAAEEQRLSRRRQLPPAE